MPWISLDESHVTGSLSAAEATALRTLQLPQGAPDPLVESIEQTVSRVQGYVAVRHEIGQPGMIPDQLLQGAIAIARWNLIGRLPAKALATDIRKQQYEDAMKELEAVAAGKFKLSITDDPADDQPGQTGGGAWGGTKAF
jgi:phage gp36-like protein